MTEEHLRHLPQSPRSALEADIVQLAPDGLTRLFRESLPTHPALSPAEARVALGMQRAGRDAAAIAERIRAPLAAVMAFLDSVKPRPTKAKAAAAAVTAPTEATVPPPADYEAPETPGADAPESEPVPAPAPPTLPPPDVELNSLQLAMTRRLRKAGVSTATISRMTRISVDQVMRIAGEIP